MRETELFEPVRDYLQRQGYQVNAEVRNCDVTAVQGDELIVVELKTSANMTLLVQATERQKLTDSVYIAIPAGQHKGRHWRGIQRVLKRLELGLLVVNLDPPGPSVTRVFDPMPTQRRKSPARRRAVIREVAERSAEYNEGGATGVPLVTAYREQAILLAACLEKLGPSAPKVLRALGTSAKTTSILSNNHYGWFQRVDRGVYAVTEQGIADIRQYDEIRSRCLDFLEKNTGD